MIEQFANDVGSTLDGSINGPTTSITVADDTGFPSVPFRIRIEDELLRVTAKSGTGDVDWTVERGIESTTAAAHDSGTELWHILTAGALGLIRADGDHDHTGANDSQVPAAGIDSGAATDGYVLTADGAGAADWEEASGGPQIATGSYTGDGVAGREITVGFTAVYLIVQTATSVGSERVALIYAGVDESKDSLSYNSAARGSGALDLAEVDQWITANGFRVGGDLNSNNSNGDGFLWKAIG